MDVRIDREFIIEMVDVGFVMLVFSYTITEVLNQYKALLRKGLGRAEANERIKQLGITRYQLQNLSTVDLYKTANNIVDEINKSLLNFEKREGAYFGLSNFLDYLQTTLADFALENGEVIHKTRSASKAIVDIIQWVSFDAITYDIRAKITDAVDFVARCGTKKQRQQLKEILEKKAPDHPCLYQIAKEYRQRPRIFS
ncbi:MAG: hypothetical protein JXR42_03535 [Gammaproteobacteria bacterium]|nr:hypothetical protein [Gammaproteobacteria bacterium]